MLLHDEGHGVFGRVRATRDGAVDGCRLLKTDAIFDWLVPMSKASRERTTAIVGSLVMMLPSCGRV